MSKRLKSILDLKPKFEDYTIVNPADGEEWIIRLRPLTAREISELNATVRRPKPKEIGFRTNPATGAVVKDEFGVPIPKLDDDSPEYQKLLAQANQTFVYRWLLACTDMEVAGNTLDDKVNTLQETVPNWAFMEIQKKLQEVQGYRTSDVALAKKKLAKTLEDTSNSKSAKSTASG